VSGDREEDLGEVRVSGWGTPVEQWRLSHVLPSIRGLWRPRSDSMLGYRLATAVASAIGGGGALVVEDDMKTLSGW